MTRHLFKLVWNRKRANALIILEIFFSFLVLFAVITLGIFFWDNARQPLGYSWQNVWKVSVDMKAGSFLGVPQDDPMVVSRLQRLERLLREIEALEPVEVAAAAMVSPYDRGGWTQNQTIGGRQVEMEANLVTDGFADVMGLEVVAGRWFREDDGAQAWDPVVIDRDLAREVFGDEDPVGRTFGEPAPTERPRRVVGVVREFRKGGELSARTSFLFQRLALDAPSWAEPRDVLLRVRPGTPAAFEEEVSALLQAVAPDWSFRIKPLSQLREASFREMLSPLVSGGVVAFFLLLMVGLGLIGVLWQNLLQRTREIGLRRAVGASRSAVRRQVVLEQLVLTTLGIALGVVLVVQLPLLDFLGALRGGVFAAGLLAAVGAIYLLSAACALYPCLLASQAQPAEALRYE
jgi:putative ABC transport system permease protein